MAKATTTATSNSSLGRRNKSNKWYPQLGVRNCSAYDTEGLTGSFNYGSLVSERETSATLYRTT